MFKSLKVSWYLRKLNDENPDTRSAAAKALGQLGDASAVKPLLKALGDGEVSVRQAAAGALGRLGQPQWSQWVKGDWQDFARLGTSGEPRAVEPLLKALGDLNGDVRGTVAYQLGQLGDARAVEPLIKALGDHTEYVCKAAAKALGRLGDARAVEPLIQALGEHNCEAAAALGRLRDARAIVPLLKALGDGEVSVRQAAAGALGRLGQPQWSQWVKGDNEDFARLGTSGEPRAIEPLIQVICDHEPPLHSWRARRKAATALLAILSRHSSLRISNAASVFQFIRQPHTDHRHGDSSCGFHSDNHTDSGFGVEIPAELRERDF